MATLNNPNVNGQVKQRVSSCKECKGKPETCSVTNYDFEIEKCKKCNALVDFNKIITKKTKKKDAM